MDSTSMQGLLRRCSAFSKLPLLALDYDFLLLVESRTTPKVVSPFSEVGAISE